MVILLIFDVSFIQSSFVEAVMPEYLPVNRVERESTHSPFTKRKALQKQQKQTTLYLCCVPYINKRSLAKKLFSDRY